MATALNNSVARAFAILSAFDAPKYELSAAEVADRTGIHIATAHRFLLTLEKVGAVARTDSGRFQLGLLLADLGGRVRLHPLLAQVVQPHVDQLVEICGETVHAAVFSGDLVTYIAKGESHRSLSIDTHVGKQLPAYCSGLGKVLLAGLDENQLESYIATTSRAALTRNTITEAALLRRELLRVARQGYAIDDGEFEEGLRCLAVPVVNGAGQVVAALSISGPESRMDRGAIEKYHLELREHATQISKKLGYFLTAATGKHGTRNHCRTRKSSRRG